MHYMIHSTKTDKFLFSVAGSGTSELNMRDSWVQAIHLARKFDAPGDAWQILQCIDASSQGNIVYFDGAKFWRVSQYRDLI